MSQSSKRYGSSWIIAACLAACGSPMPGPSTDAGPDSPPIPHDAAPRADAGPRLEAVNVSVTNESGALRDATVVIDDAIGVRHTGTTGADGRVRLTMVAWGNDRVTITAYSENHPIVSLAGFRHADLGDHVDGTGVITVPLQAYYDPIGLRGSFTNVADTSHYFFVSADIFGDLQSTGTTYDGSLMAGAPFNLYAYETAYASTSRYSFTYDIVRAIQVPHAALTRATVVDLDMSTSLPLTTVTGSIPVPSDGNRAQIGDANIVVSADDTLDNPTLGFASAMDLDADGVTMNFTATYLATIAPTMPRTIIYFQTEEGIYTEINLGSLPTASPIAAATDYLFPPRVTSPTTQPLHDPIELADIDPTTDVRVVLRSTYTLWHLLLPPGGTEVVIPAPPDGIDTSSWTDLSASVSACDPWPGRRDDCRRVAGGDVVTLTM